MNEKKESFFEEFLEDRFLFYMDEWSRKCDPDKKIMALEKEDHLKEILKKVSKEDSCFLTEYIEEILTQNAEKTKDGLISLEKVRCLGFCGKGPNMSINGEIYTNLDSNKVNELIKRIIEDNNKKH